MNQTEERPGPAKPSAETLVAAAKASSKKGPPPVHLWNPPFCGDLDMRIARDGNWFYLGTPIGRKPLVKLFASIDLRSAGRTGSTSTNSLLKLVTPDEYFRQKVGIKVDDAPFVAVDFDVSGSGPSQEVTFTTNVEDETTAGPDRPLRVARDPETGEVSPYVLVRANLEALVDRKSFYRLVDICVHETREGRRWFGLWSKGAFFPFIPSAELE